MNTAPSQTTKHVGSCHCKAIRFEVELDASSASRCNCTICTKIASTGAIVAPIAFALLTPESATSQYTWGTKSGTRYFCGTCGVHCFARGHLEQLGGDYVSINFNCLDDLDLRDVAITHWDGRHNTWAAGQRSTPWPIA